MKKSYIITLVVLTLFLAAPFSVNVSASDDQLAKIKAAGKIIIGSDTTYAPFESLDKDGNAVGFDVDFAKELAKRLGVTAEIKTVVWDTIIPELNLGSFDVIISAMTITEERDKVIDFSIPYYNSTQGVIVAEGNPKKLNSVEDLNDASVKVGVQRGTTSHAYANDSLPNAELVVLDNFDELYPKLDLGEIDAILGDTPVIGYAAQTGAVKAELIDEFGAPEQFGVGMRENEPELKKAINDAITAMLDDGTYDTIKSNWFGSVANDEGAPLDFTFALLGIGFITVVTILRRRKNY